MAVDCCTNMQSSLAPLVAKIESLSTEMETDCNKKRQTKTGLSNSNVNYEL